jgi:hypothetical protein
MHSWGVFADQKNAVSKLASCYQGVRVVAAGNPGAHYNAKELEQQCYTLMDQTGFYAGTECNTVGTWHRIWYNVAQITLGEIEQNNFNRPYWANRPVNPSSYDHRIGGLNRFNNDASYILTGQKIIIELDIPEADLIPYIDYLLGAGPDTFAWQWGASGGNARRPHLVMKRPVNINYGYVIRDNLNVAPAAVPIDPALPGLPANIGIPANTVVGDWSQDLLERAIMVLARSMPIASDIEAGCIKTAIDVSAEQFRGVILQENCGRNEANSGYNAFLDQGETPMPHGNHICNMGTMITEGSTATRAAISRARQCMDMMRRVEGIRALAEMHILPLQLACRQLGLTAAISFPNLQNVNANNVPALGVTSASRGGTLHSLVAKTVDEPSQLLLTTSLMMQIIYGTVLPESAMYFKYGNIREDAHFPLPQEANIGECLTSVHAAQVTNNMLQPEAVGLAGIPNNLDVLAAEARVAMTGVSNATIVGESNSTVSDGEAQALPGLHMLGHAIIMTRDSMLQAGDVFEVEVAGFKTVNDGEATHDQTRASAVPLDLHSRYAFCESNNFNAGALKCRAMTLFADFDIQRFCDLRLSLPNSPSVSGYLTSADNRARVPGFVAAMIAGNFGALTGNIGIVLMQRSTKRRKVGAVAAPVIRNADEGDGDGEEGV